MCNPTSQDCPAGTFCGSPSDYDISLQEDGVSNNENFNYGIVNFDSIGTAFLLVFQLVTGAGWTG